MNETKLFFIRDGQIRNKSAGNQTFYLRCWFVTASCNEHAWRIMTNLYRRETNATNWLGLAAQPGSGTDDREEGDLDPVPLTNPHEIAAWVSRVENTPVIYVENGSWAFASRSSEGRASDPTLSGVMVQEVSVEMGFTEEEVEIGMERSLILKLEE